MNNKVLITGITGFLASHITIQLLNKGYKVIGTLRSHDRIDSIKSTIETHTKNIHNLSFAVADLNDDTVWDELTRDVDLIQHVASPHPRQAPKSDDELLLPAKQGTLNILKSAAKNGVKRVVMTSSLGAVAYGKSNGELKKILNEEDWTDETNLSDTTAYYRSKTVAEKAAWGFVSYRDIDLELVTICPGAILGPILESDFGTSANIVISLMDGSFPAIPKIEFDIVDVRSVADLQILAMESPTAKGKRYIATAGHLTLKEISQILKGKYPNTKIPVTELPNFVTKFLSLFQPMLKSILLETHNRKTTNGKAINELGWVPISPQDAVISCAESLLLNKILK